MSLASIQRMVHVTKDKKNDFGGYNYRTAEGILAAVKSALPEGYSVSCSDTLQEIAGQIFVTATATITGEKGVSWSATGHAMHPLQKKGMDPSQITGAASSYARKTALCGLLALDDGSVDPDATNNKEGAAGTLLPQVVLDAAIGAESLESLAKVWAANKAWQHDPEFRAAKDARKQELQKEAE